MAVYSLRYQNVDKIMPYYLILAFAQNKTVQSDLDYLQIR